MKTHVQMQFNLKQWVWSVKFEMVEGTDGWIMISVDYKITDQWAKYIDLIGSGPNDFM